MHQIELEGLCKIFKVHKRPEGRFGMLRGAFIRETRLVKALDHVSFKIDDGELVGYIGPNGAGKSTTVKIMSGILTPEQGTCKIMGRVPWRDRVAHVSRIGVVFGQRSQLWWDVPVSDSFSLLKDIYNIPDPQYKKRLADLVEILNMEDMLNTPVRQLSLGQRMRCEVAASLLHSPRILFLDEPTIGLDAVSKLALRAFLKNENIKNGITMILTTHDMDDMESLCNRVMVIGHGNLLYDGNLKDLKSRYAPMRRLRVTIDEDLSLSDGNSFTMPDDAFYKAIGAERTDLTGNVCSLMFNPSKRPAHALVEQLASRLPLKDIVIEEVDIDEMIASMYKEMGL